MGVKHQGRLLVCVEVFMGVNTIPSLLSEQTMLYIGMLGILVWCGFEFARSYLQR